MIMIQNNDNNHLLFIHIANNSPKVRAVSSPRISPHSSHLTRPHPDAVRRNVIIIICCCGLISNMINYEFKCCWSHTSQVIKSRRVSNRLHYFGSNVGSATKHASQWQTATKIYSWITQRRVITVNKLDCVKIEKIGINTESFLRISRGDSNLCFWYTIGKF